MTNDSFCSHATTQILPRIVVPLLLIASVLVALRSIVHSRIIFGDIHNSYNPNDNYNDNREETVTARKLSFLDYSPKFQRTKYTFDSFVIGEDDDNNKIDLAQFGLEPDEGKNGNGSNNIGNKNKNKQHPSTVTLFRDFDLRNRLLGNETWIELLEYRRDDTRLSLSFYVDKVAFKRWLHSSSSQAHNNDNLGGIESIESFLLKYKTELVALQRDVNGNDKSNTNDNNHGNTLSDEIRQWLPVDEDYAAKPTHLSCSGGVWLVHNDPQKNTTYVGNGKKKMTKFRSSTSNDDDSSAVDVRTTIADDLASNLQKVQEKCGRTVVESYALRHVRPGIVVEERFTQPNTMVDTNTGTNSNNDNDNVDTHHNAAGDESFFKGGMEFKVFTIWGRAWLTVWRPGTDGVKALLFRNGTNLVFDSPPAKKKHKKDKNEDKNKKNEPPSIRQQQQRQQLPEWIDWDRVISIGERLGRNKDMFRTDIFVGVGTAGGRKQQQGGNDSNKMIRYVVSETEIHPTPLRGLEQVFEEAGRLWLAGYYLLSRQNRLSVVSNTEVPQEFYGASRSNTN